jgi:dihydrofolate synthase/folylpolyglutamate synthase
VIPSPLLQIITSIGMDHTDILGETIEEIAFEKAGIIKGGTTVLYPLQDSRAQAVIGARCEETGSQLIGPELSRLHDVKADDFFSAFTYDDISYRKSLPGQVQVYNCITVITAARVLQRLGVALSEEDIRFGIEETHVPARMEVLWKAPLIMLDGSHNPDGALALEQSLQAYSHRPITLMMGVMQDKDAKGMLQSLGKLARRFIAVTPDQPRAMSAQSLAQEARAICREVCHYDDLSTAVQETLESLTAEDLLLVCGSLYFASEVRPMLLEAIDRKWDGSNHESALEDSE